VEPVKLNHDSNLPFEDVVLSDGRRLVRIKVPATGYAAEEANRNLFLVDAEGRVVWRVAYHECVHGDDPFVGFNVGADGVVTGLTWDGWKLEINLADGTLKETGWTKS
jgi:hypothetical protein